MHVILRRKYCGCGMKIASNKVSQRKIGKLVEIGKIKRGKNNGNRKSRRAVSSC